MFDIGDVVKTKSSFTHMVKDVRKVLLSPLLESCLIKLDNGDDGRYTSEDFELLIPAKYNFKPGDKVVYAREGIMDGEHCNWCEKDNLVKGRVYEVRHHNQSGRLGIVLEKSNGAKGQYILSRYHFDLYQEEEEKESEVRSKEAKETVSNLPWILNFMSTKSRLVNTDEHELLNQKDWEWLMSLSKKDAEKVRNQITYAFTSRSASDSDICPWCIVHNNRCSVCDYGARHGRCGDKESLYQLMIADIQQSFFTKMLVSIGDVSKLKQINGVKDARDSEVKKKRTFRVKSKLRMLIQLISDGYTVSMKGHWTHRDHISFGRSMFNYCGKEFEVEGDFDSDGDIWICSGDHHGYYRRKWLEEIANPVGIIEKPAKTYRVKSRSNIIRTLRNSGYAVDKNGDWYNSTGIFAFFRKDMFRYCGKELESEENWCKDCGTISLIDPTNNGLHHDYYWHYSWLEHV